jgi:hypothetical protein
VRSTIACSLAFDELLRRDAADRAAPEDGNYVVAVAAETIVPHRLHADAGFTREEKLVAASGVEYAGHADDFSLEIRDDTLVLVDHRVERSEITITNASGRCHAFGHKQWMMWVLLATRSSRD